MVSKIVIQFAAHNVEKANQIHFFSKKSNLRQKYLVSVPYNELGTQLHKYEDVSSVSNARRCFCTMRN